MRNVGVYFLIIIFIVTTLVVYIIYGKMLFSDKVVNIVKIKSIEIEKSEYTGEYTEIMVKDSSELSFYLNQYNISELSYEVNWDNDFILMTYPYEISRCTYSLGNDRNKLHVMDIIYSKTTSSNLNIYVVNGREFITWEATGTNKDIRFE